MVIPCCTFGDVGNAPLNQTLAAGMGEEGNLVHMESAANPCGKSAFSYNNSLGKSARSNPSQT